MISHQVNLFVYYEEKVLLTKVAEKLKELRKKKWSIWYLGKSKKYL